jgi:hypothetical protein
MEDILEISCDEAGHTGPDLLHKDQRYFAYASVAVSDAEAFEIIQKARADHPVQMPELKASRLLASKRGRQLITALVTTIEGRYAVIVHDKLLALCGWFFEYIYEPVYQDDSRLLYDKNLHRFVAMYTWLWMTDHESEAKTAITQFQKYIRSRDPSDAPFLFARARPPLTLEGREHPFECVLRFAYGYRDIIVADNARLSAELPEGARWTLDLSPSALWSHLNYWGRTGKLLSVHCDASKPLQANIANSSGDENDPVIRRERMKRNSELLGWRLLESVAFVDSRDHPAIQLADVVAGTAVSIYANGLPKGYESIGENIFRHLHEHSIMPDTDVIDLATRSAAVNALILHDLAERAERHGDPYENLTATYHIAEVSWASGDFRRLRAAAGL